MISIITRLGMGDPFKWHVCVVTADEIRSRAGSGPVDGTLNGIRMEWVNNASMLSAAALL